MSYWARWEYTEEAMNTLTQTELILSCPQPLDQNPAAIYIASLRAETGRRTQAELLRASWMRTMTI